MCDYISLSYRLGTIIQASTGGSETKKFSNDFSSARKIGSVIVANSKEYLDKIGHAIDALESVSGSINQEDCVTARFSPGLIIDFPEILISYKGWELTSRSCLTVCAGDSQSKIWTRVVRRISDGQQKLSRDDVIELKNVSELICSNVNPVVQSIYSDHFGSAIETDIVLQTVGDLEIFAVDCVGEDISDEIRDTYTDLIADIESVPLPEGELANVLREITNATLPDVEVCQDVDDSTKEYVLHPDARFVPFQSKREDKSFFVASATEDHAYLVGLVDAGVDVENPIVDPRSGLPLSAGTTAELASKYGAVY